MGGGIETMRWVVGSDHGGVELRDALVAWLREAGHEVLEVRGPSRSDQSTDYPDVAAEVCERLRAQLHDGPGAFGLLVCGTGQGMAMSANRFAGIRAAVVGDVFSAKMAREHNDANVICLGQRVLGPGLATELLAAFCAARFGEGRHARRVGKIEALSGSASGGGSHQGPAGS